MKALLLGANGQLGRALRATAPASTDLISRGRDALDIANFGDIWRCAEDVQPAIILNAAAYTAVDKAEHDSDAAYAVNAQAVGQLADVARAIGARLVHVSTDFVFDGLASAPYDPDAPANPINVYGASKLEGERLAGHDAIVVRTSWLYSHTGSNFVGTMLRLMENKPEVRVVSDQIGSPTYATGLASAIWDLAASDVAGIFHYSDSGTASWYDFAVAIQEEAIAIGILGQSVPIIPITTAEYPTAAQRPRYSVLDKRKTEALLGRASPHWRVNLRRMLTVLKSSALESGTR